MFGFQYQKVLLFSGFDVEYYTEAIDLGKKSN